MDIKEQIEQANQFVGTIEFNGSEVSLIAAALTVYSTLISNGALADPGEDVLEVYLSVVDKIQSIFD